MEISRTDFDDMNLNSLISVFNNELFEKFQSDRTDITPEMQALELEWSRAYQAKGILVKLHFEFFSVFINRFHILVFLTK